MKLGGSVGLVMTQCKSGRV